jgi:hypothetical protein
MVSADVQRRPGRVWARSFQVDYRMAAKGSEMAPWRGELGTLVKTLCNIGVNLRERTIRTVFEEATERPALAAEALNSPPHC